MLLAPERVHFLLESAAYAVGFRVHLRERRRLGIRALADREAALVIVAGAILGAALGSKIAYWLYDPGYALAAFPDPWRLLEGKSVIGALLGGLAGVEFAKRLARVDESTGDAFVLPLAAGLVVGRIGCFLAGLADHTYGNPTSLPWGVDFGDGIPRHPTQLYEIVFVVALAAWIRMRDAHFERAGDRFRAFLAGYLLYRLAIECIRPMPTVYFGLVSGLQLLCVAGLTYYLRDLPRLGRAMAWARS